MGENSAAVGKCKEESVAKRSPRHPPQRWRGLGMRIGRRVKQLPQGGLIKDFAGSRWDQPLRKEENLC